MISKGLDDHFDYRYSFNRLDDLNLPLDFVNVLKNQAQKIACLVHQNYLTKREEGWGFTDNVPALAKQEGVLHSDVWGR